MFLLHSDLLNSIDPSVDPCQDFYQYACGGWMKKNPLPPTSFQWDQFEKLTTKNDELIEMLLENKELKAIYSRVRNMMCYVFTHAHISGH